MPPPHISHFSNYHLYRHRLLKTATRLFHLRKGKPSIQFQLVMEVVDMSNTPTSRTKDFFDSPALSLTLAGIFKYANAPATAAGESMRAEEGEEGSDGGGFGGGHGGGGRRQETVDISSENSEPVRSSDDLEGAGDHDYEEDGGEDKYNMKKRKRYHRHTAEQIREMEALFRGCPHPDEKQRQELSKQLGLAPSQVKFWFQNRRTQIKAFQERHEYSLLRGEMEKLREENKAMRETISKACCPNCGSTNSGGDSGLTTDQEQQLRKENAKLREEVEKLRMALKKCCPPSSGSAGNGKDSASPSDFNKGFFGHEKRRIMEIVTRAMEELQKMATAEEPLWIRSVETGRAILNYDEYVKEFGGEFLGNGRPVRWIEASRETAVVFLDLPRIVQSFMDVNQWKQMFPCLISKADTIDTICSGEAANRDGAAQLMFAELQMLTPLVATREVYFVRYCKQLSAEKWAIVDVSIDKVEDDIDASLVKCRKRPSGCIIEDKSNGHCEVVWVEHMECQKSTVHTMYRTIVSSGMAFGAKHWMETLQLQSEWLLFFMATNVPTKDSPGVTTVAGRKSVLKLAQRMTRSFCRAIGASSYHTWNKVPSKTGEDIRVSSRRNLNDPGEPRGMIVCTVSSVWLPVPPDILFDFLRDEARRSQWHIMSDGVPAKSIAKLAKGQDRGNAVTLLTIKSKGNSQWVLQDCTTNAYESMVVYAPVDITSMQSVITGCDSSSLPILSSGFSILPDGLESRSLVITSRQEEKGTGGSLLTIAFQTLTNTSPTGNLTLESVEPVNALISCTLRNIKTSLQCEDS